MQKIKTCLSAFGRGEKRLWAASAMAIVLAFVLFDRENYLILAASLVGVTALIFNARGYPVGQLLMVVFSLLYGIISYTFSYYGEMATYLGMTAPMAIAAYIGWKKNPFEEGKGEVKVNRISAGEQIVMWLLTAAVTAAFYFILKAFNTANLLPSTLSVATSFLAVYLTWRRSPYYAIGYGANDVVLILLWTLAAAEDPAYFSVEVCFGAFLINDLYGFVCWKKMERRQGEQK